MIVYEGPCLEQGVKAVSCR